LQKALGYISWPNFFSISLNNSILKLASLWFDEIAFQIPKRSVNESFLPGLIDEMVQEPKLGCSKTAEQELKKIWIEIEKIIPDYTYSFDIVKGNDDPEIVNAVFDVTYDETMKKWLSLNKNKPPVSNSDFGKFGHEIFWANLGLRESVDAWFQINTIKPCTFLPTPRERILIDRLFSGKNQKEPLELFSTILQAKIPDFTNWTWDEVIELRKHPFINNFRRKIVELSSNLNNLSQGSSIEEIVNNVCYEEMVEFLNAFRPSSLSKGLSIINGVASNIPLPIPVNPYGVGLSVKDSKKQFDISKKYGWLYFYLDLPTVAHDKHFKTVDT
jgi:hypothetical protein